MKFIFFIIIILKDLFLFLYIIYNIYDICINNITRYYNIAHNNHNNSIIIHNNYKNVLIL